MNHDERVERAETEALFREVNDRIAESARRFAAVTTMFVCECSDPNCTERFEASLAQYDAARDHGAALVVAPDHAYEDVER